MYGSGRSAHAGPTWGICRRWSIIHSWSTPAASASVAIDRRCSARRSRPPGQSKLDRCRPTLMPGVGSGLRPRPRGAAAVAAGRQRRRHDDDRLRRDAARPMARREPRRGSPATGAAGCRRHRLARRPLVPRCVAGTPPAGVSNTTATHGTPAESASCRQRARRSASRPSESITVVSRRRRRRATMSSSSAKASAEARRSCSFSPTTARKRVARHDWRREVLGRPGRLARRDRTDQHDQ